MKEGYPKGFQLLLLVSVFVVATCGLIYELVAGTLASYLLGDSVTQFSTIIGTYLFSMGIGSYLSKYFKHNLVSWFVRVEILVGLVGGFSSCILYLVFEQILYFRLVLYLLVSLTGILVGLEIPLLMRILKDRLEFSELVSKIFTFDYIGALLASIIFPLLLIPYLGILRTSFLFGILNVGVAWFICYRFGTEIPGVRFLKIWAITVVLFLVTGFILSDKLIRFAESLAYQEKIIFAKSSPYQRIILTRNANELRLYLNGNLQFSSMDEYRYHESLVHPGLASLKEPKNILVMGGGDGLAVREILKYNSVESITLVDLDKAVTELFKSGSLLTALNQNSLSSPKIKVINEDAFVWIKNQNKQFDFIVVDFPDPSNYSLGKLYSVSFYRELKKILKHQGCIVIQSTSPFVARKSYWIVNQTLKTVGFSTLPYHCYIPSFGEWGFVLAFNNTFNMPSEFPGGLKFINAESFRQLTVFPPDMSEIMCEANSLNNQVLVNTFEKEWAAYSK
ncbi:MAG TPA: polyamine aminopropyltransferase [Cyclobacteriaceae bacterium]|nr:polyamine aminopropyltransferase [Cyclobacteriaceae bacterium]